MMNEQLNKRLLHAVSEQLPENKNLSLVLMEILSLSREAVYRRMRGEVMFTFDDIAKISSKLGISIDKIIGESKVTESNQWAFFNTNTLLPPGFSTKYIDQHLNRLKIMTQLFKNIHGANAIFRYATCNVPHYLTVNYKCLTAFRHYKRAYLSEGINPDFLFSNMFLSPEVYEIEKSFYKIPANIPKQTLILGRRCFLILVEDINYFHKRRLISDEERMKLKNELLSILLQMEKMAATGIYNDKAEVSLYLSDVNLESSYFHIESDNYVSALQLTYFVDILSFYSPTICQIQKEWIDSLKRYSTLISQTGEMQRSEFFKAQREMIETLM